MKSKNIKKVGISSLVATILITSLVGGVFLSARETKNRAIENEKNIASMQATIKGMEGNFKRMLNNQEKMITLMLKNK